MNANLGTVDRTIRVVGGSILVAVGLSLVKGLVGMGPRRAWSGPHLQRNHRLLPRVQDPPHPDFQEA